MILVTKLPSSKLLGRDLELERKLFTIEAGTKSDQFLEVRKEIMIYYGRTYREGANTKEII